MKKYLKNGTPIHNTILATIRVAYAPIITKGFVGRCPFMSNMNT